MLSLNAEELNLTGSIPLVVVTSLEVTARSPDFIRESGSSIREPLAIDHNIKHILSSSSSLITDCVRKLCPDGDFCERLRGSLTTIFVLRNTKGELATAAVVELGNGLLGDFVIDVDLANAHAFGAEINALQRAVQAIQLSLGVERSLLAELGTAVFAVCGGCTLGLLGDFHDQRVVLHEEVFFPRGLGLAICKFGTRS